MYLRFFFSLRSGNLYIAMIIDTHAHLNFKAFDQDRDKVIRDSLRDNLWIVNVGTKYETSQKALELALRYDRGVYAAIGLHPIHIKTDVMKIKMDPAEGGFSPAGEEFDKGKYRELILSAPPGKLVAIGEVGLDYYYRPKSQSKRLVFKEKQKEVLREQLELAKEFNLPLIFHCRMAYQDLLDLVDQFEADKNCKLRGVVHCFAGSAEEAQGFLKRDFYIGFNAIIFKLPLDQVILNTPPERILFETDSPYLIPPQVKEERNEPSFIKHAMEKVAQLKGISFEDISAISTQNARELLKI